MVVGLALAGCAGNQAGSTPATQPPKPSLSSFVPTSAIVTGEQSVQLLPTGPAQVVVTYTSQDQATSGFTYRDLIILSWDQFPKRWVNVFDGSKVPAPAARALSDQSNAVLPTSANIVRLESFPIRSAKGRTDLAFWSFLNFGADGSLEVGIVHYDGQTASVSYFQTYHPASQGTPELIGQTPHQQLSISAGWLTMDDPQCCAIRTYVNTVGYRSQTYPGGSTGEAYVVTSSTQSWLGANLAIPHDSSGGTTKPNPVVTSVIPGSPAAPALRPGDQLVSVSGASAPADSSLGPPVIDEIAQSLPGATIPLVILRSGAQQVVNVTLASTASTADAQTSPPQVGYLGVEVVNGLYGITGATITQFSSESPAESAGLSAGDTITSIGSTPISSAQALGSALLLLPPGTSAQVAYEDQSGTGSSVTVQVGAYPSDSDTPAPQVTSI